MKLDREISYLDIEKIELNSYQPRQVFSKEGIRDLAQSIEENGLIQPIIVRPRDGKYQLIAGERRLRALKLLGRNKVESLVIGVSSEDSSKLALIENIQREDLNIFEEGQGFKTIIDNFNITQEELAKNIGKSRSYIANAIRLLRLSSSIKEDIVEGRLSVGHGKVLLSIEDEVLQEEIRKKIINSSLTVRQAEDLVRSMAKTSKEKPKKVKKKDPYVESLEEELMVHFGTKVKLKTKGDKGAINIEFYSEDDLVRILELLY